MKVCTKCNYQKPLQEFHNCKSKPGGKMSACKSCRNSYNREKAQEVGHDVLYRKYKDKNPERYKENSRNYYQKNKKRIKRKAKDWKLENKERSKALAKQHYDKNKEKYKEKAREWSKSNIEKRREISRNYWKRLRGERPEVYSVVTCSRKMIGRVMASTGKKKRGKTFDLLGYNKQQFIERIESQFTDGMTWENYGDWHIDHIIPISELVACGVKEPSKINCLSNLRPLWAKDNLKKGNAFELSPVETSHITRKS